MDTKEYVASLLSTSGAILMLSDAGSQLCGAVARGDSDFLKKVLTYGIDPISKDYDHRSPLHIAAAEGIYNIAKFLIENGASVLEVDRRGTTPLNEARKGGDKLLVRLLEDDKSEELYSFPGSRAQEIQANNIHPRKCTVFAFHPWDSETKRREGVMLWVPHIMEELIRSSAEQLQCFNAPVHSFFPRKVAGYLILR